MKFSKQIIDNIFKCYSVNALNISGETQLIFAAEGDGSCQIYSGDDFSTKTTLWQGGGGTMSIVPIPDKEGYFFASKGFYSMVDSRFSTIVLIRYKDGEFKEEKILEIPYLHRFDIFNVNGKRYLLAASIHSGKENKEDWSNPGKLFTAEIPFDLDGQINVELTILKESLTKNHGYGRGVWNGAECGFIGSEEGVFAIIPPQHNSDNWSIEQIFNQPVSDVTAIDMDGDGELEFALIEPFHGDKFVIYKKNQGEYKEVYSYPVHMNFYHAIDAGNINGVPTIVGGARRDDQQLFIIQYDKETDQYKNIVIDRNVGSSNVKIINTKNGNIIMSANREIGQAAIYNI